ncbi:MAG TPA: NAD(P)/FAD-dependent oxidoreductase [Anaerolineaceae bacterium]
MQKSHYDAIVIGAGLSGLTAAAFLAQGGARVLVCEQGAQVGGLFNSFWRNGYQFDGGIKAVESSAVILPMLAQLGLLERIPLIDSPIALITGGRIQPIHAIGDVDAYFHWLGELFPTQQSGLQQVLRDARFVFEILDGMLSFPIPFFDRPGWGNNARADWVRAHSALLPRLPRAAGMMRRELRPYLEQHLSDGALVNLLSGLFPDGTSLFFGLGYFRMFLDYHYPRGGIQVIPNQLAGAIEDWGGEICLNTRVERILLKDGQARGVRLSSGDELTAGHIVAACDLRHALTALAPESELPRPFANRLNRAEVSHSVLNVFLGIDLPVERFNLQGCHHIFYSPDLQGITEADRISRADYFAHVPQEISVPCLHDPALAPPGKTGLNLSAMTSWQYLGGWQRSPAEYAALKNECARQMIVSLEQYVPGLSNHIEFCEVSTPRTIHTLTGNTQGAIMGWSYHRQRTLPRGNFYQMRSSVLTPIPRLLTAGHWSYSPGGSPVAVLTGKLAAENVLNSIQNAK